MSNHALNIQLTEEQLSTAISALLFSCSVNVVSNTNNEYQNELFALAKELKKIKPDIKLDNIQFLKEDDYEESCSEELLSVFKNNLEVTSFDKI
jgi:hypothetical protein